MPEVNSEKTNSVASLDLYRQRALLGNQPVCISRITISVDSTTGRLIDTRRGFYTRCPHKIPGPNGTTKYLYVDGLTCHSAAVLHVEQIARLAPFTENEKESMPFADVRVYDNSQERFTLLKDLTGKEGSLVACGFDGNAAFKGYLTFNNTRGSNPCSFIPDFIKASERSSRAFSWATRTLFSWHN